MKKIIIMISILALITGTSCKGKEKVSNDSSTTKTMQNEKKYRLVVSFFSIGTGIDNDAMTKFNEFVSKHPKKPSYLQSKWGREGEVDFSFNLKEFKKAEDQATFIAELKKAIGDSDRVRFTENGTSKGTPTK